MLPEGVTCVTHFATQLTNESHVQVTLDMSFHISFLCHDFATSVTTELDRASVTVSLRHHAVQHCTQVWVKGVVNRCS